MTGGWGRFGGPTSVVNGPADADADDSVDGILSKPAKGLGHQRHKVQTGGVAGLKIKPIAQVRTYSRACFRRLAWVIIKMAAKPKKFIVVRW